MLTNTREAMMGLIGIDHIVPFELLLLWLAQGNAESGLNLFVRHRIDKVDPIVRYCAE